MPSPLRPVVFDSRVHLTHRLSSYERPLRMHDPRLPHESPSGSQCRISPSWSPPFALLRHNHVPQSPFPSIVSRLHTPLPPPLRVPQVRLRAEREAAEWRFFWLSFFAGMVITSVFVPFGEPLPLC